MKIIRAQFLHVGMVLLSLVISSGIAKGDVPTQAGSDAAARISGSAFLYLPLTWVGKAAPGDEETLLLDKEVGQLSRTNVAPVMASLGAFAASRPNSPWTPAIQANLGRFYCQRAEFHSAIEAWQAAWAATRNYTNGPGKQIADYSQAFLTKLLLGLGQMNEAKRLLDQYEGRKPDSIQLRQMAAINRDAYRAMVAHSDTSFRCGIYALNKVESALNMRYDHGSSSSIPGPTTGFSLAKLAEISGKNGSGLVPVKWSGEKQPIVAPCVVHWKDDHFAAILSASNGNCRIADTLFGDTLVIPQESVRKETDGYFLIVSNQLTSDWAIVNQTDGAEVFGKGDFTVILDPDDGCETCGCGCGGSGGGSAGGDGNDGGIGGSGGIGGGVPPTAVGMPVWSVSEPNINLWVKDTPLTYGTALGGDVVFSLSYKQRDYVTWDITPPRHISTNFFSVGPNWHCSWLSYVTFPATSTDAYLMQARGAFRSYNTNFDVSSNQFYNGSTMKKVATNSGPTSYVVSQADGSKQIYGYIPTNTVDGESVALLTSQVDSYGHSNWFNYTSIGGVVRLVSVVDADGKTCALSYSNASNPALITGVSDSYGHSIVLRYDALGMLTNIIDAANISSSFVYDDIGQITNLITPYGTNVFEHYTGSGSIVRAIRAIDPSSGTNVYVLVNESYEFPGNYHIPNPSVTLDGTTNTFDSGADAYRNSFHWGPLQANQLPASYDDFVYTNFVKASIKHWLHRESQVISQILEMEQDPSPDGINPGQATRYRYQGASSSFYVGSSAKPLITVRILPDGTTNFTRTFRNQWGNPTNVAESYAASDGTFSVRTHIYNYDSAGIHVIEHIDPTGATNFYLYDANNNLVAQTNAVGDVTRYSYNANQQLTGIVFPTGLIRTNFYTNNWLAQTYDFVATTSGTTYFATNSYAYTNGDLWTQRDGRDLTITNSYDALRRLTNSAYPDGTSITYVYSNLDLVRVNDRLGGVTQYEYDRMRRKITETNALLATTRYSYCTCGSLESTSNALAEITHYYYNGQGRLTQTVYPGNYSVTRYLDLLGRVTNEVDSSGASITNFYNNQGLLCSVWNTAGMVKSNAFDINDRLIRSVDSLGIPVTMTYDALGRVLTKTYNDGGIERYGYSSFGLVAYTNQLTNATHYGYDAARHKIAETNANNEVTLYAYTPAGDLKTLTDGKTNTTYWGYDSYGRVTNKMDATSAQILRYAYDVGGRLTNRWSAAKSNTVYSYDKVGNLTNVAYRTNSTLKFKYDALNRLTNMVDGIGTTAYTYVNGNLTGEDGPWTNDAVTYSWQNRLRTGASLQQPGGSAWALSYGFDSARRLTNIASPTGNYAYDYTGPDPRVKDIYFPFGSSNVIGFDAVGRVASRNFMRNGTNIMARGYTNDLAGRRTGIGLDDGNSIAYGYDAIGQVTSASAKDGSGNARPDQQLGYVYDPAGNLKTRTNNALIQAFNINNLNELSNATRSGSLTVVGAATRIAASVTVNGSAATLIQDTPNWSTFARANVSLTDGQNTFTAIATDASGKKTTNSVTAYLPANASFLYDANGNLTNDGLRRFDYDDENQLIHVTVTNKWKSDFAYDGKMRRRVRTEAVWINSAWVTNQIIRYVYDGNLVIQERDSNNAPLVTYTRGLDLSDSFEGAGGIGGLLARTDTSSDPTAYYVSDANGNVIGLVNNIGTPLAQYNYDPFGNLLSKYGPLADANLYRFSSKEWHQNSGLVYYLYRFYDPNLQRWVNRDPIQEKGGFNLFEFVGNSPIGRIDMLGLGTWVIKKVDVDFDDPHVSTHASKDADPRGFQVTYIPSAGECCSPNTIVLSQIVTPPSGASDYHTHVDGGPPPHKSIPGSILPDIMGYGSYIDSPTWGGGNPLPGTWQITAVAYCRDNTTGNQLLLSTYYFEWDNNNRSFDFKNTSNKKHYYDGMRNWYGQ